VLAFDGETPAQIRPAWLSAFREFVAFARAFAPQQIDAAAFEPFSASAITGQLAGLLNKIA
jgi:hypothetical protein